MALDGGYNFVAQVGEKVGDAEQIGGHSLGSMLSVIVGSHENGSPMRAYLMEIKQEWRDEDVAEKLKVANAIDDQIRAGIEDGGEFGNEHRYIPEGGIKYDA